MKSVFNNSLKRENSSSESYSQTSSNSAIDPEIVREERDKEEEAGRNDDPEAPKSDLHALQLAASIVEDGKSSSESNHNIDTTNDTSQQEVGDSVSDNSQNKDFQRQIEEVLGIVNPDGTPGANSDLSSALDNKQSNNEYVQLNAAAYNRILQESMQSISHPDPSQNSDDASSSAQQGNSLSMFDPFKNINSNLTRNNANLSSEQYNLNSPESTAAAAAALAAAMGISTHDSSVDGSESLSQFNQVSRSGYSDQMSRRSLAPSSSKSAINNHSGVSNDGGSITSSQHQQQQQNMMNIDDVTGKRRVRVRWTNEETEYLIEGCKVYGVGNWKKILMDPRFHFNKRTAVDLKDRFRTSFPEDYGRLYPNATTHKSKHQAREVDSSRLKKINRKERCRFTPEEDERLLQGFNKHGASWSKIQTDPEFGFQSRRSTDLRDRFRNAFPERYVAAGYKGRRSKASQVKQESQQMMSNEYFKSSLIDPEAVAAIAMTNGMSPDAVNAAMADLHQRHQNHIQQRAESTEQQDTSFSSTYTDPQPEANVSYSSGNGNLSPTLKAAAEAFAQSRMVSQNDGDVLNNSIQGASDSLTKDVDSSVQIENDTTQEQALSVRSIEQGQLGHEEEKEDDQTPHGVTQAEVMASIKLEAFEDAVSPRPEHDNEINHELEASYAQLQKSSEEYNEENISQVDTTGGENIAIEEQFNSSNHVSEKHEPGIDKDQTQSSEVESSKKRSAKLDENYDEENEDEDTFRKRLRQK